MAGRIIETNITEEDVRLEGSLRPQTLKEYIGQQKKACKSILMLPRAEVRVWIMYYSMVLQDLEKQPWPGLLQMKWEHT